MNDLLKYYRRNCYLFGAEVVITIMVILKGIPLLLDYIDTGKQEQFALLCLNFTLISLNLFAIRSNLKTQREIERYLNYWRGKNG